MNYSIEPIGYLQTCFPEKFGIPRQPLLAPSTTGLIQLSPPFNHKDCVEGLEKVSHLWLTFIFHHNIDKGWKPKVRPPRLGGNEKMGVFATRSSFRPNALGLSVVKLEEIIIDNDKVSLRVSGVDVVDGTPIIDMKPYVPYADKIDSAYNDFAEYFPVTVTVKFSSKVIEFCEEYQTKNCVFLQQMIDEVLQQNPKPAYHQTVRNQVGEVQDKPREYGMRLLDCNIRWYCHMNDFSESNNQEIIEVFDISIIDNQ